MKNVNKRLFLDINSKSYKLLENINTHDMTKRIYNILLVLKPILKIIFEEFSSKNYPSIFPNNKYIPPRLNHNGLNHLRQMFFCAFTMLNTSLISNLSMSNTDIFLILLCAYCKSIGRVNEGSPIGTEPFTDDDFNNVFHQQKMIPPKCEKFTTRGIIEVIPINSMLILDQILYNITDKFNLKNSQYYSNILYYGSFTPKYKSEDEITNITTNEELLLKISGLISVGHTLDHGRPTTGYSVLDVKPESSIPGSDIQHLEKGQGDFWSSIFLNKWKDYQYPDWQSMKTKFVKYQVDLFTASGYNKKVGARHDHEININWGKRFVNENMFSVKYNNMPQEFIELSNDFDLAWESFYNVDML
jgi:hypothetical protein